MPNNDDQAQRKVGRPRTLQDEAIFQAVYKVLAQRGTSGLTLATVAAELECSAPALVKRFGSRRKLILAFAQWSAQQARADLERARRADASSLAELQAWLLHPTAPGMDQPTGSSGLANGLQLYVTEAADPEFRAIWKRWIEAYETGIVRILDEAVAGEELVAQCDTVALGRTLHLAMAGAGTLWIGDPERETQERSREAFEVIIGPWRP